MILFITPKPETIVPLEKGKFFTGAYQSYFFFQLYNNDIAHEEIKLIFDYQYREEKLTEDVKIIMPLGKQAWKLIGDRKIGLDEARGSVFEETLNGLPLLIIPTFHPEELKSPYRLFSDSKIDKSYCFRGDIRKARYILDNGYQRAEERFNLNPTLKDIETFVDEAIKNKWLLGTDIEATGLSIEFAEIFCIGFAWNDSDCIVIPLLKEDKAEYWSPGDKKRVVDLLTRLFHSGRFLFQNGIGYDVPLLRARGFDFPLESFTDDTMLLHHALNPELEHKIGFISSFYGQQPYWKNEFLIKKIPIWKMDQEQMKRYNARDCVALHQIYKPMMYELKQKELESVYEISMSLAPVIIEMQETGIEVDPVKLKAWQRYLDKEIAETFAELLKIKKLPEGFNFASGSHLAFLLYGKKDKQFKNLSKLEDYEKHYTYGYNCQECGRKINVKYHWKDIPNEEIKKQCPKCKVETSFKLGEYPKKEAKAKSKTSSDYLKLKALKDVSDLIPFTPPNAFKIPTTKEGYGTDKVAITKYIIAVNKRLEELEHLKRASDHHKEENNKLKKLQKYLETYQKYSSLLKLKVSFYNFKYDSKGHKIMWNDGRLRPQILVHGTATGRFSCKKPNLQQMPAHNLGDKMRDIFKAGEGRTLLSIDFSNLEVQVGARFMGDETLIKILETGKNMHDENTKTFFGVNDKNPKWKSLRFASKKIMFGRLLYGGSDNGIYAKVMTEVPDCGLTLKKFKEAVANYINAHPDYIVWVDKMIALAHNERISLNAYGRKRYLHGDSNQIERQALNTPIQGSSADTINLDMIEIYREMKRQGLKSKLVLPVHDELIFECWNDELKQVYEIAKKVMTRERHINGYDFVIPIDAEIGSHWGSLTSFDEETMQPKLSEGSKH